MRRLVLGTATALVLLASGCGGDDPSTAPTPSAQSTDAGSGSSAASSPSDPVASSSSDTYADAAPATGTELTTDTVSLHAPADWSTRIVPGPLGEAVGGPQGNPRYQLSITDYATSRLDGSTDAAAELALTTSRVDPPLRRLDDVVIADTPAYHLAGPDDTLIPSFTDEFGLRHEGRSITVSIQTPPDMPQDQRDTIVSSIVASFTFTS